MKNVKRIRYAALKENETISYVLQYSSKFFDTEKTALKNYYYNNYCHCKNKKCGLKAILKVTVEEIRIK